MKKFQQIFNDIKNELSFGSFNNIFSESTKIFDLKPCDILHPIKRILIDKDGHDNIFQMIILLMSLNLGLMKDLLNGFHL